MGYKKEKLEKLNEVLVSNPFVNSGFKIVKQQFSEQLSGSEAKKYFTAEVDKSVKVYIKAEYRLQYSALSPRASKLFGWVLYELKSGKDWFWLNKKRYMDETKVSINTYKGAIQELCDTNYLCSTPHKDIYWINPVRIFRGSRSDKYPDHVEYRDEHIVEIKQKVTVDKDGIKRL
jgi:hypothetical protein